MFVFNFQHVAKQINDVKRGTLLCSQLFVKKIQDYIIVLLYKYGTVIDEREAPTH